MLKIKTYLLISLTFFAVCLAKDTRLPNDWDSDSQALYDLMVAQLKHSGIDYSGSVDTLVKFAKREKDDDLYVKAFKALLQTERYADAVALVADWGKQKKAAIRRFQILAFTLNNEVDAAFNAFNEGLQSLDATDSAGFDKLAFDHIQILMTHWYKPEVASLFEKLYAKYPTNELIGNSYVELLRWQGEVDKAVAIVKKQRFNDPKNVELAQKQSDIYRYNVNLVQAEKVWTDLLNDYPNESMFRFAYAQFLFDRYDFHGALKQLKLVDSKDLEEVGNTLEMMTLVQLEKYDEAVRFFEQHLANRDNHRRVRYTLAEQLMQKKQYDKAKAILSPLVDFAADKTDPLTYSAAAEMGTAIYATSKADQLAEGDEWFAKVAAHFQLSDEDAIRAVAGALADSHHEKVAYQRLSAFLEKNPNHEGIRYTRGLVGADMQMTDAAIDDLEIIHAASPEDMDVQNALGYTLLSDKNRHDEGRTLIKKALFNKPNNPAIVDSMGWITYLDKDYAAALPYFRFSYINYLDGEVIGHYILGLYQAGKVDVAKKLYQLESQYPPNVEKINKHVGAYLSQLKN